MTKSGVIGGLGAAYGERSTEIIAKILYPDEAINKLSQDEKQDEVRETLGENTISQITNGVLNFWGDTFDFGAGVADTVLDAVLALGSCTMGASYCETAKIDLKSANQTVYDAMVAIGSGAVWDSFIDNLSKAIDGDQIALEKFAVGLFSVLAPSKIVAGNTGKIGKVVNKVDNIASDASAVLGIQKLNHKATSGAFLTTDPNKTTTILVTYIDDTQYIIKELNLEKSTDFGGRKGGFNLLNTPDEYYKNPTQFWNEYNKPWLDNAIKRGDNIILATKPIDTKLYRLNIDTGLKELTGFGREYHYLLENGYKYNSKTNQMYKVK